MNPPMINSTSSVSTTKRKREAERSVNWTVEETQVLLCAWSDERVQKSLAENLRNRHVFKHLSARMSEMGFSRSPHQCRLRVKTLKANYVRAKLQRSVDGGGGGGGGGGSQPCAFKYFAEMDAVLGRRSAGGGGVGVGGGGGGAVAEGVPYFISQERAAQDPNSHHFGALGRAGRQRPSPLEARGGRQPWQPDSRVKLENAEDSTDEFEFEFGDGDAGFPRRARDRRHGVYLESSVQRDMMAGTPVENGLSTPSPRVGPPPPSPPPPLTQSAASPLPDPSPGALPASGNNNNNHHHHHHLLESSGLAPVLKHLSESFQWLVSETRGLLVQLESQRQEQARWHQELLAQWLQREERRQREAAEREERRERARMEHELRVLELLAGLAKEHGCRCGGNRAASEAPSGPGPATTTTTDRDRS